MTGLIRKQRCKRRRLRVYKGRFGFLLTIILVWIRVKVWILFLNCLLLLRLGSCWALLRVTPCF